MYSDHASKQIADELKNPDISEITVMKSWQRIMRAFIRKIRRVDNYAVANGMLYYIRMH